MTDHDVVSREAWAAAREELLTREKEHTRLGDELARQRRKLPWVRVDKAYRFETEEGTRTLPELFDGRSEASIRITATIAHGERAHTIASGSSSRKRSPTRR